MNWMDELANEMFARAFRETLKSMKNEFRKSKIDKIYNSDQSPSIDGKEKDDDKDGDSLRRNN